MVSEEKDFQEELPLRDEPRVGSTRQLVVVVLGMVMLVVPVLILALTLM